MSFWIRLADCSIRNSDVFAGRRGLLHSLQYIEWRNEEVTGIFNQEARQQMERTFCAYIEHNNNDDKHTNDEDEQTVFTSDDDCDGNCGSDGNGNGDCDDDSDYADEDNDYDKLVKGDEDEDNGEEEDDGDGNDNGEGNGGKDEHANDKDYDDGGDGSDAGEAGVPVLTFSMMVTTHQGDDTDNGDSGSDGDGSGGELLAVKRMTCSRAPQTTTLSFFSPETRGEHVLKLWVVFDSIYGMDVEHDVHVNCTEDAPPSESGTDEDEGE